MVFTFLIFLILLFVVGYFMLHVLFLSLLVFNKHIHMINNNKSTNNLYTLAFDAACAHMRAMTYGG